MAEAPAPRFPTFDEIGNTEDRIGNLLSDLDWYAGQVDAIADGERLPLEDYAFMVKTGVRLPDEPAPEIDLEAYARLVTLAVELDADGDKIKAYAAQLRARLPIVYRDVMTRAALDG